MFLCAEGAFTQEHFKTPIIGNRRSKAKILTSVQSVLEKETVTKPREKKSLDIDFIVRRKKCVVRAN